MGLTDKEKAQILSINMANNPNRLYKEVWIGLGGTQSAVYATEVSPEEYLCYTTEETEKIQVLNKAAQLGGNIESAIRVLANEKKRRQCMKALKLIIRIAAGVGTILAALLTAAVWLFSILARMITGIARKIQ